VPDRPLLVTADPELLDDLLRLCAVAGVEAEVAPDVPAARPRWLEAPVVVLGDDQARAALAAPLPHRSGVLLVARDRDDGDVWTCAEALGVESTQLLPGSEALLVERLAAHPSAGAVTVSVVGGRGGAGASTLAGALAVTGSADRSTLLVDADRIGGGLDLILGGEHVHGLRWPDLAGAGGQVSAPALSEALPVVGGVRVLSWGRGDPRPVPPVAARAVLEAARRAHDLVVVDLPRHLDEAAAAAAAASDLAILVVPAEVRAVAAAARVASSVGRLAPDVRVVVRGPAPSGLTGDLVAESLGLPLAGWLRPEPGLGRSLERGEPPAVSGRGPLAELSRALLGSLAVPYGSAA
jgi:secretion/DNA translocation related CpaE-like protein